MDFRCNRKKTARKENVILAYKYLNHQMPVYILSQLEIFVSLSVYRQ